MFEGFVPLKKEKVCLIGYVNLVQISAFFKKRTAQKKWKLHGKSSGKATCFFSHGSSHSKGVLVLVRDNLDFNLKSVKVDELGRYILLEATI